MAARTLFITGTDTGVGKTVLTSLLAAQLHSCGVRVAAVKPFCSGGRDDASRLRAALGGASPLDEINPWHYRAPLAPLLAARADGRRVGLSETLAYLRRARSCCEVLLVEGAGGLLSPLGEDLLRQDRNPRSEGRKKLEIRSPKSEPRRLMESFDARDLIAELGTAPVVVCPNRLGAINQVLLVLAALPRSAARQARVVLVSQPRPGFASAGNAKFLAEKLGGDRVAVLPWLGEGWKLSRALARKDVQNALAAAFGSENEKCSMLNRSPASRPG